MEQAQESLPVPPASQGNQGPQTKQQHLQPTSAKRNSRQPKQHSQSVSPMDGAVSDSVVQPSTAPRSKKNPKQRQQSVAAATIPQDHDYTNRAKSRPVSLGPGMVPATPAKEQAYAGPTFQASPAPSSLPVPKFFSRSVPNVAAQQRSLESRMAGDNTPDADKSSPEVDVIAPARSTQMSPLDMFFRADREEKQRSASLQSPEMLQRQAIPATEPRNVSQQKNAFLQELDGDGAMPSPRTVPRASRPPPPERLPSSDTEGVFAYSDNEREAATKSLKDLLFKVEATPPPPRTDRNTRNSPSPFDSSPSPIQRSASGPSTPTPAHDPQNYYSLHYGNRANLSPLFKAARADTPPSRPSGLRQQELASELTSPTRSQHPQQNSLDPDGFSRRYLDQQIRASQPATMPPIPLPNGASNNNNSRSQSEGGPVLNPQNNGIQPNGAPPRTGSSGDANGQDVRTMEENPRRMLKINVLSN